MGVDGCPKGWMAVVLRDGVASGHFVARIEDLTTALSDVECVGVDIPIGLAEDRHRAADRAAKRILGRRASTIFLVPSREVLRLEPYGVANQRWRELSGAGLSRQAYGLRSKVLEVDQWLDAAPCPVWEVHPEVSFAELLGEPIAASKKTPKGVALRRAALADAGVVLDGVAEAFSRVAGVDDVLDAGVVAWTARRILQGRARFVPEEPETDARGRAMVIRA